MNDSPEDGAAAGVVAAARREERGCARRALSSSGNLPAIDSTYIGIYASVSVCVYGRIHLNGVIWSSRGQLVCGLTWSGGGLAALGGGGLVFRGLFGASRCQGERRGF